MAYAILPKDVSINQLCKIAEDDTEKNSFNIIESDYRIIEISNSDFTGVQQDTKVINSSTVDSVTFVDVATKESPTDPGQFVGETVIENEDMLTTHLNQRIQNIDAFLKNNPTNPMYSFWNTYKTTLQNFDPSVISFPHTGSWEKYCADNGIAYKHMLQLP